MKGVFITGTGTDVGKTVVTAGIVRGLRNRGLDLLPAKPIQTGAEQDSSGEWRAADFEFTVRAANLELSPVERKFLTPFLYKTPCSPHLAARLEGRSLPLGQVLDSMNSVKSEALAVEGAGGIYVPINEEETMLDLMKALRFPVILVSHAGLGTINHTLLSIEALRNAGLEVVGVVYNKFASQGELHEILEDNPNAVEQFSGVATLGIVDNVFINGNWDWELLEKNLTGLDRIHEKVVGQ